MKRIILYALVLFVTVYSATAQTVRSGVAKRTTYHKKWEFGVGGSVFQFSRTSFTNFAKMDKGYRFDLKMKQAVFGGNIYVARELNNHFYIDFQSVIGATTESLHNDKSETKWLYTAALGVQWRLGDYFNSKYIDPYLRGGIGYMYKGFDINYTGTEGLSDEEMTWLHDNISNKDGRDRNHMMPISLGLGLNMWLNDNWGIGIQGDYVLMPYSNVANSLEGTVRVMYRIGGGVKK